VARYIDAEAVDFSPLKDDFDRVRAKVIIMGQPTAEVVKVVRCKDCKYCNKYAKWNGTDYYGCNFNVADIYEIEPTHFCSCGERKEVTEE
jgi:hypothetical protein